MPVLTITKDTNLIYNETRYYVRIDGFIVKGFDTLEKAEEIADILAKNGGKERTDEVTLKEIIC